MAIALILATAQTAFLGQADAQPSRTTTIALNEQTNLAALLDLCAKRLGLALEFDAEALRKVTVTLRSEQGLDESDLWATTNRLLAANGWASIGHPSSRLVSIVKITDAAKRAPVVRSLGEAGDAGFITIMRPLARASPAAAIKAAEALKSDPGGSVRAVGETSTLLISDLRPRLLDILNVLDELDRQPGETDALVVEQIEVTNLDAVQLVAQVTAAVQARDAIEPRPLRGKVTASLTGDSVILIAPHDAATAWRALVAQFDRREPVVSRTYAPRQFTVAEVARLIEQTVRGRRGGSGTEWRLVQDELTATLVISATAREHEAIEALMTRLDSVPAQGRRPVRTFVVRNRSVVELLQVLERLIEGDALAGEIDSVPPHEGVAANQAPADTGSAPATQSPPQSPSPSAGRPANRSQSSSSAPVTLMADETTNTLIAVGEPRVLAQVEALLKALDIRHPQVQLELFMVSLSEGDTFDLGVELRKLEVSGQTLIGLGSLFGLSNLPIDAPAVRPVGRGFSGVILSPGDFSVVIRALETVNRGSSRSMPVVLVNNNQQATLDSVVQEPFSSTNASDTVATTSFGGTQDAGTQITVTPHIAAGDHLVLEYSVSLSAFVGDSSDPALPPPRQQTKLQSTVTIPDGHTIAIGGLEVVNEGESISQVPLLGGIPLLGEAFKSRSRTMGRTRFFVFIRAEILRHDGFEDLKYFSRPVGREAGVEDGWPVLEPRIIRSPAGPG